MKYGWSRNVLSVVAKVGKVAALTHQSGKVASDRPFVNVHHFTVKAQSVAQIVRELHCLRVERLVVDSLKDGVENGDAMGFAPFRGPVNDLRFQLLLFSHDW
jgi:hypothetical protein